MFEGCRPAGRLFYCLLAVVMTALSVLSSARASDPPGKGTKESSPTASSPAAEPSPRAPSPQSGATLTSVIDTVYMADGSPAQGILVITWPAFVTSAGNAVAPGELQVTLGTNGALNVSLAPNAGANPANTYYTVVYQLQPDEVRTEYWMVPTTSPATLAQVRTTPGSGTAAQPVSMQYVDTALATKANDNAVVHLANAETITGVKSFTVSPNVPTPVNTTDVANKSYVDNSVAAVGAGNYLPTAGGTMTGPITLSGNPTAPLQAAPKQYVDVSAAAKADLVNGLVPVTELGSGTPSALNCLLGNGTWGACGSSANATEIQSIPVGPTTPSNGQVLAYSATAGQYLPSTLPGGVGGVSVSPSASQNIAQPEGTQFSTNNLANIRYVTSSWNWSQSPSDNLSTPGAHTIHLSPCPLGLDTSSSSNYYLYSVYISGTGVSEAVPVTGSSGSCPPGAASGTITVTTSYAHGAGYTVGSASGGIQEAWNDAWVSDTQTESSPYVKLASNTTYNIYSSVYLRGRGGILDGAGSLWNCFTRDRCIYVGTTEGNPYVNHHKIYNLTLLPQLSVDGAQVASVSASSGTYTVTTATNHSFVVGDTVDCEYHSQTADQHWASVVQSVPNGTTFTVQFGASTFSAGAATFGFCALLNAGIENNSDHVALQDFNVAGSTGKFTYAIVNDNDQQFIVERASNRSTETILSTANFPNGAFVYERNDQGNNGITYLHNSELTNVNCATAGGNGFVFTDSVCQGFPTFGVRYFGGLQPATFENIYQESTGATDNPLYGSLSAQAGLVIQGGAGTKILGTFPLSGYSPVFATGGSSSAQRDYFVVPRSSTLGYGPVLFIGSAEPSSGTVSIPLAWPSVDLQTAAAQSLGTLTWDILVTTGTSPVPPFGTGTFAIATNASGTCGANGMCSFTDTQAAPASYTVASQQFTPMLWFWPVSLAINNTTVFADEIGSAISAVATQGTLGVSIVAGQCQSAGVASQRTPLWITCLASDSNSGSGSMATVLQQQDDSNNGPAANSKGRLNFGKPIGNLPNDLLTLQDSNFSKTLANAGERPANDAGDMAVGVDQSGGLSLRAATSISSYIGVVPNGSNFLERLTASSKTFNVPVTINGNLTLTGTCTGCGGGGSGTVASGDATQLAMYSSNGTTVSGDSALTDNGSTLNYSGSNGISAAAGTFSGNVTVNGQLLVAGPWVVSSPVPGSAMGPAGAGLSSLGISSDGNFYISANSGTPQKIATTATSSYFSNLFQEDANDIGEYNGTTAQNLHVYSSYSNSSTWQRTSVGYDSTDNYAVVRSESSPAGGAPGLGFWINNGLKWVVDADGNFKPWTDQTYNVGTFNSSGSGSGLRPGTVYVAGNSTSGSGFELGKFANESYEICNDTTSGTIINGLAVLTAAGCAAKPSSALTSGAIGVVIASAGTSGVATLARAGSAYCSFDGTATVIGDYVVPSATASSGFYPLCHDAGSTLPTTGTQVLGRVLQASAGSTTVQVFLDMPGSSVSGSGAGIGSCTNQAVTALTSGAPTCSTITSAYVDSSIAPTSNPAFTGTLTINGKNIGFDLYVSKSGNYTFADTDHAHVFVSGDSSADTYTLPAPTSTTFANGWYVVVKNGSGGGTIALTPASGTTIDGQSSLTMPSYSVTRIFSDGTNYHTDIVSPAGYIPANYVMASPNGSSGMMAPRALVSADIPNNAANTTGTAANLSGTPALPNGTTATTQSAGDNSTKLATTAYVRSEAQFAWTCPIAGSTSVSQNCNWTLPAALTITGFDFAANTAPSGCSTYATFQIWDGTAAAEVGSYSITLSSGTNFYTQVTGSTNVAAGHLLRVKVTTAASGCGTNAGGMVATVTYQMQN